MHRFRKRRQQLDQADGVESPPPASVIGWSDDIHIGTDLTEPAVPPEDWYIVSDPERVLSGIPSTDPR